MPGRGAWLHPTPECFELAVRRKAFGRALRLQAAVDLQAVAHHVGAHPQQAVAALAPTITSEERSNAHEAG